MDPKALVAAALGLPARLLEALRSRLPGVAGKGKAKGKGKAMPADPVDAAVSLLDLGGVDERVVVPASSLGPKKAGVGELAAGAVETLRAHPALAIGLAAGAGGLLLATLGLVLFMAAPKPVAAPLPPERKWIDLAATLEPPVPPPDAPVFPLERPRRTVWTAEELRGLMPDLRNVDTRDVEARARADFEAMLDALE